MSKESSDNKKAHKTAMELLRTELNDHILFLENSLKKKQLSDVRVRSELKRCFHMLKGGAGFFQFNELELFSRELENIFGMEYSAKEERKVELILKKLKKISLTTTEADE